MIRFFVWLSFGFGSPRWFPVVLPHCGCHVEAPQGHPSPQSLVALPFPPTRARAVAELQSPRFQDENLQGFGRKIQVPPTRARTFTSRNLQIVASKVCAGKVPSHVPSPTRARIGVSSFTSRNLRDSGPQSVCRQSPMSCAFASARAHWCKLIHVPKPSK